MRICVITQSDPFFLAENIDFLIKNLPNHSHIVATVVFDASPFANKEKTFYSKMIKTLSVFGPDFFIRYGILYIINKFNSRKNVYKILRKYNVPAISLKQRINHPDSLNKIKVFNPDLLVSIAGNQIFKKPLLELARHGCINLHTALLPKYRGLLPSFWVLKNNEKETGVSVFFVDEGIDSGPILIQKRVPIKSDISHRDLIKITKKMGMEAIIDAIELIHRGVFIRIPNKDEDMTYYSFPTRKDVKEFYKIGKRFY